MLLFTSTGRMRSWSEDEVDENELVIEHCPDILGFMRCHDIQCEDGQRSRGEDEDKDIYTYTQNEKWVK